MDFLSTPLRSSVFKLVRSAAVLASGMAITGVAHAGFVDFVIRGNATINHPGAGQTEIILDVGGEKAALGSNDINGQLLGSLQRVAITRLDDITRFTPGSGPAVAPYLNIWITDGLGHYAVAANEPSNPEFQGYYDKGYDLSFADLSGMTVKLYENADLSWVKNSGVGLKFSDLAGYRIEAPTAALLQAGWAGLGGGAPRELGTNTAYGENWVFGDTLSNYVSGQQGYIVSDASVSAAAAVPEPASLALVALGLAAIGARRRRK